MADILNLESYARFLKGIDTVIHLAAKVHSVPKTPGEAVDFRRINTEGTRKVLDAAAKAGVRRFLFASTVAVLGPMHGSPGDAYAESKRDAEEAVRGYRDRMDVLIVRPTTVYGPFDRGNVYRLIRWIDRGLPPVIGPGTNRKSLLFVRNLADAIDFLLSHGKNGEAYTVTDGQDVSQAQIADAICRHLGRRNRWPRIPLGVAHAVAAANECVARNLGAPLIIGKETVRKLADETVFDATPLFSMGFSSRFHLEQGMKEAVQWYKRSIH